MSELPQVPTIFIELNLLNAKIIPGVKCCTHQFPFVNISLQKIIANDKIESYYLK